MSDQSTIVAGKQPQAARRQFMKNSAVALAGAALPAINFAQMAAVTERQFSPSEPATTRQLAPPSLDTWIKPLLSRELATRVCPSSDTSTADHSAAGKT